MARPVENRHGIAAIVIGAMEIVFGIIIMACSFAVGAKISGNSSVSPYWAGIPYLLPGILGIISGITKNFCAMIAFMVLNIICFVIDGVAAIILFLLIGIWLAVVSELTKNCEYQHALKQCRCKHSGKFYYYKVDDCDTLKAIVNLLWTIIIFAVIAALTSLAGSILGCIATCCRSSPPPQQTVIVQQPAVMMQQSMQPPPMQPQMQAAPPAYGMEKQ